MKRLGLDGLDSTSGPSRHGKSMRTTAGRRPRSLISTAVSAAEAIRSAGFRGTRARDFEDFVAGDRGWTASLTPLPDPAWTVPRLSELGRHGRGEAVPFTIDLSKRFPNLPRAPIVEAVIHWQARATKTWQPDELKATLAARLPDGPA